MVKNPFMGTTIQYFGGIKIHPSHNHVNYVRNPNIMSTLASNANMRVGNILDNIGMVKKEKE
jgi:hypothetical protein